MNWLTASLIAQALLAAYFQLVQWFPLGRWNYQPGFTPFGVQVAHGRGTALDLLLLAIFVTPVVIFRFAYLKRLRWLMWVCALGYAIWLALEIKTWWVAYAFGASNQWIRVYDRVFSQSTQLLPAFGHHLPPDGLHLVLQVLLIVVVVCTMVGLMKTRGPARKEGRSLSS